MARKLLSVIAAMIFVTLDQSFAQPNQKTEIKFVAKVSDVRLSSTLLSQGKTNDDIIIATVPSIMFNPILEFKDVRDGSSHTIPEISILLHYHKKLIEGSVNEILGFWLKKERNPKKELLSNPERMNQARDYYLNNPGLKVIGIVYQKKTSSVLIDIGELILGYSFKVKNGKYYLTDNPTNDLELAIIEASFATAK